MLVYNTDDIKNPRMIQVGVVQGGVVPCESNRYPNIYNRLDSPLVLTWLREEIFKGEFYKWIHFKDQNGNFFKK